MKKIYTILILISLIFSTQICRSQIITTTPSFPTADAAIIVTFDASFGNQGLKDFTGNVYAHTGVITDKSDDKWAYAPTWGDNSEKYKLTALGDNKWEFKTTSSIREFYGVPADEEIQKLAFVFRSENPEPTNYLEGKDNDNKDIFIDLSEGGLNVEFTTPADNSIFGKNESVLITANSEASNNLELLIDGESMTSTSSTQLNFSYTPNAAGNHQLIAVAIAGEKVARDTVNIVFRVDAPTATKPDGIKDGINYIDDNTVTLSLYAPNKEYVFVIGDFNDWNYDNNFQMNKDGDYFWLTLDNLTAGKEYVFQYVIDGDIKIADPYADKILDPWNDEYISDSTYPDLISYPSDKTSEIASVFQTAQTSYTWSDSEFSAPQKEDLVVYELHIRDFTAAGDIKTVKDTLDYLERLGINAIELMPFNEFEGNDSWGYNPAFYFAPDKAYGTKNDYKNFINECHKRGIAVIMDMVLNHSYGQSPFLRMYFDGSKPSADNPWYNVDNNFENTDAHWGYDFNHESIETQKLVDRINAYWMSEYHVDGYRFDFTKGFSNTPHDSSDPWGGNYDAARIRLLKRMADQIWAKNDKAFISFEHLSENSEEKELANYGILLWGNANPNYNEATMGYNESSKSDLNWTSWQNRGWNEPNIVNYMESHDEERLMYKNLQYGNVADDYSTKDLNTALSRMEEAAAFFFTIPGPKMVWQFGELGYDESIDENGRVGKKPIHWEYQDNPNRKRLYEIYSALIELKKEEEAFESDNFTLITNSALKRIEINHTDMNIRVIGNFDVVSGEIDPNFSQTGTWYNYFSGSEINVSNVNAEISLEPGEYRIYTTKKLTTPDIISAPIANNVSVSGVYKENEILTATYIYSDANDDLEGSSVYQWYSADDAEGTNETTITDANQLSYTLGANDRNKFIRFSIIPVAQTGDFLTGDIVYSSYTDEIVSLVNPPVASNLEINGELIQDAILTGSYTFTDTEGDTEGNSVIQWYHADDLSGTNETAIAVATSLEYTISRQDVGLFIRFSVSPVASTGELLTGTTVYSAYTEEIGYATGIEEVLDEDLEIYPNPVQDLLYLDNLNQVKRINIYSLTGRMILSKNTPDANEVLNIRHLNRGIYILILDLEDGSRLTKKIIKQ